MTLPHPLPADEGGYVVVRESHVIRPETDEGFAPWGACLETAEHPGPEADLQSGPAATDTLAPSSS